MNTFVRTLIVGTVIAFSGGAIALAAGAADPAAGTWILNVAKSKFTPGPGPKSLTRTYTQTADGTSLSLTGVAADGSPIAAKSTFKYDGKDYAYTGSPNYDTLSIKRVNGSTVKATLKKSGAAVGTTTRTISGHGKVMTLTSQGKDAKGADFKEVTVFDKQ